MTEIGLLSRCELYLKLSRHLVPGNDLNYDAHTHTTVAILFPSNKPGAPGTEW